MRKYSLNYMKNGKFIEININKLLLDRGISTTTLESIDKFTSEFISIGELLNYLKYKNLIPSYIDNIFICIEDNFGKRRISNSSELIFKNESHMFDIKFLRDIIFKLMSNPNLTEDIIRKLRINYQNVLIKQEKLNEILCLIIGKEYNHYPAEVEKFFTEEFFRMDKNGVLKIKYREIHDFIVILKLLNLIPVEYDKEENEYEEFLTEDDFERSRILTEEEENERLNKFFEDEQIRLSDLVKEQYPYYYELVKPKTLSKKLNNNIDGQISFDDLKNK